MFEQEYFQNDEAAREHLESLLWPSGPICPHCGCTGNISKTKSSRRAGLYTCNDCRKQFTVTVGTVFASSHVPLHKWLQAAYLLCSSKKGMSAHQIHRSIGVTYKTAWFMMHRIREAMTAEGEAPLGGEGGTVEVDETYWGNIPGMPKRHAWHHKHKIVSLVEREGSARSFHVAKVSGATLKPMLREHIARETRIMTDEAGYYNWVGTEFAEHHTVHHKAGEYSRGEITTNTVEGYFATMKRGLDGVYHHVSGDHLGRYLAEFDFRYNHRDVSDAERTMSALQGITGKRLFYRDSSMVV